jgi:hypothetical protein
MFGEIPCNSRHYCLNCRYALLTFPHGEGAIALLLPAARRSANAAPMIVRQLPDNFLCARAKRVSINESIDIALSLPWRDATISMHN